MNYETLYYIKRDGTEIPVVRNEEDGSLWITSPSLAKLLGKDRSSIQRKIRNEIGPKGVEPGSVCAKIAHIAHIGKTYYTKHFLVSFLIETGILKEGKTEKGFLQWIEVQTKRDLPEIIRYHADNLDLDIRFSAVENTCWLTQNQMAMLFGTTQQKISSHLGNILASGELEDGSVHKDFLYTAADGKAYSVAHYNLDAVLAVGYRVNSARGIEFR